jgi:hypothetical protein
MCNLYSMRRSRDELVGLFKISQEAGFEIVPIIPDTWTDRR